MDGTSEQTAPIEAPARESDAEPTPRQAPQAAPPAPTFVIRPRQGWDVRALRELWEYRELLYFLVWRDVKVKYKQTLLGFAWAILVPLVQMVIFGFIFGRIAKMKTDGLNPYLFYLAATTPWQYFAASLTQSSNSLVTFRNLLTKIYLPRIFMPLGACLSPLVDFAIAFVILLGIMAWMGIAPATATLFVPAVMAMAVATALGTGLLFAALNVKYRDIRMAIPFIVQVWMYVTIIVPFSNLPQELGRWRYLYALNPMVGVVESFRWCLMHPHMEAAAPWPLVAMGLPVTALLFGGGFFYFKRVERMFADLV